MKEYLLLIVSFMSAVHCGGGRMITDGFVSQFVRPSPSRESQGFDECFRLFNVYLPEAFFTNPDETFPIVYHLVGFGGNNTTESRPDEIVMNQLIESNQIVPMILVLLDPQILNFNSSFYTDSPVVGDTDESFNGKFERYIVEELIPFVDEKYRQKTTQDGQSAPFRAIMGQSMGGYASLYYGIKYPNLFSAFTGNSPTSFWVINTALASPDLNPMFTFQKLLTPGLNATGGVLDPGVNDDTEGFFGWAGAFSPTTSGAALLPPNEASCTFQQNSCLQSFPFCVAYPFQVNPDGSPVIVGGNFVQNDSIISVWEQFDPYTFLDESRVQQLARQAIYFDAGDDLQREIVDNVGARYLSDRLIDLDIKHEYLLYSGGHISCISLQELECYRYATDVKLFSGKFSEAGVFAPDVRMTFVGSVNLVFEDFAVFSINNKELVGFETDPDDGISQTDVSITLLGSARFEIGNDTTNGGGLQVGNDFDKAQLLHDPSRVDNTINILLTINGPDATFEIGRQGFLGFGVGIDGNQTDVSNFWGLSSLTNLSSVILNFQQGRFVHNQIASSLAQRGSLIALGQSTNGYTLDLNQEQFVISGGGNLASMTQANRIHPTVMTTAGEINPGFIRTRIVEQPATMFDEFYGQPTVPGATGGIYASRVFSLNQMNVGILSSSLMLFDTNKLPLPTGASQQDTFTFLAVADYQEQGRKRAPIANLDGNLTIGSISSDEIIRSEIVDEPSCNVLSVPFDQEKVLQEGAVGIKRAIIDGQEQIIRVYDLDPIV